MDAGRRSTEQGDLLQALEHYRKATRLAPDSATAQLALGEAAEALGEFDEALSAYQAAARRAPSTTTWLRLGEMADRMGQVDVAIQSLEQAYGPWRQHASLGLKVGVVVLVACVPSHWPDLSALWGVCLPTATRLGRSTFRSSHEVVPEYVFRILVEAGRRGQAIALARTRGWLREKGDYCQGQDLPVSAETAGLLAMMLEPDRVDCLLALGVRITDEGLARLGRLVLLDRAQRSRNSGAERRRVGAALSPARPRGAKLAESLNVTGWRLQNRNSQSTAALAVFTKAIDADPAFSWPITTSDGFTWGRTTTRKR